MKHCASDTRHTRPNLDDNMMIYLKPVPSQGWLELWRAVVVECARRTAVISHSLVRWNTYMVEGLFFPGIFKSWMQLSQRHDDRRPRWSRVHSWYFSSCDIIQNTRVVSTFIMSAVYLAWLHKTCHAPERRLAARTQCRYQWWELGYLLCAAAATTARRIINIPGTYFRRSRLLRRTCSAYSPTSQPLSSGNCRRGNYYCWGTPPKFFAFFAFCDVLVSYFARFYLLLSPSYACRKEHFPFLFMVCSALLRTRTFFHYYFFAGLFLVRTMYEYIRACCRRASSDIYYHCTASTAQYSTAQSTRTTSSKTSTRWFEKVRCIERWRPGLMPRVETVLSIPRPRRTTGVTCCSADSRICLRSHSST